MFLTDSQIPDVQFFLFLVQMFHIRFLPGLALPASLQEEMKMQETNLQDLLILHPMHGHIMDWRVCI